MRSKRTALAAILFSLLVLGGTERCLFANESNLHLIPIEANFDTRPPYGKQYGRLVEEFLFPARRWVLRYFQAQGEPQYETGLTIYQKSGGNYWLMLRQVKPGIGDIIINGYYGRLDLKKALRSMKMETSDREIPRDVAVELRDLWTTLLHETRGKNEAERFYYVHPVKVILSAKDGRGIILSGKYPPDAAKHRIFTSIETIVDKLVESCDASAAMRQKLLTDATKMARDLRKNLERH